MAGCFLLLTVKLVVPALICAVLSLAAILAWTWQLDRGTEFGPIDIGGGIKVPVYVTGSRSHGWWAMVVLILVGGALYLSYIFSYLYLWLMSPEVWQPVAASLPSIAWPAGSVALLLVSLAVLGVVRRLLPAPGKHGPAAAVLLVLGALLLLAAPLSDLNGLWQSGLRPRRDSHGALIYLGTVLNLQVIAAVVVMAGFGAAKLLVGKLDRERRVTIEITNLLALYAAGQQAFTLLLVHGFPRLVG
jgi:cytochrome c oxidase subunit I+III